MVAEKKRLDWADIIKGLGMLVVVFSHFPHPKEANIFYTPFFMAIFFFVSGWFFSPRSGFKDFVINKFSKLVVPMLLFGSLGIIESVLIGGESLAERVAGLLLQIGGKQDAMWFFACIFTAELLFWLVYRTAEKFFSSSVSALTGLTVLLAAVGILLCRAKIMLPWHFETACVAEIFFLCGHLGRKYRLNEKISLPGCIGAWLLYLLLVGFFPNPVDMHLDKFGNVFLFYIQALVGVYATMSLSVLVTGKGGKANGFVIWVGQNTVQYYFFQGTVISVVCRLMSMVGITAGGSIVLSVLCTIAIYIVVCVPAYIVRRYFPFFLGKR